MHLSKLANDVNLSPTLAISAKAKQLKKDGKDVISLSAGEPDLGTPSHIKNAGVGAITSGKTTYTPATGTPELKEAIINKFKNDNGLEYNQDEIMVNCGAKHSLFNLIMCLCDQGDEVIVPAPYWVSYPEMVKAAGADAVAADCRSDFKLTPEILKDYLTKKTKLIILNSPSNPTGYVYTKEELEKLGDILLEHDVLIISDEIYEHLVYEGTFTSIASISEELKEQTVVVNGVSKAYAMTGWRIGYAAGNSEIIGACAKLQSHSTSNPATFSQYGAQEALTSPKSKKSVSEMRDIFKQRRDYVYETLSNIEGIEVEKPSGAFYIFPSILNLLNEKITTSMDFAEKLLEEELVACVPGEGFGAPGYIRLSYAASMEDLKKAMNRIQNFTQGL
ncbi:MAG: pyridoxal phosphate-dependent aminotransferase [Elusimicrobiota bacterium]